MTLPFAMTRIASSLRLTALPLALVASIAGAQAVAPSPATPALPPSAASVSAESLAEFAWLEGCWTGNVNQRDFREQWMPLRGGMRVCCDFAHRVFGVCGRVFRSMRTRAIAPM